MHVSACVWGCVDGSGDDLHPGPRSRIAHPSVSRVMAARSHSPLRARRPCVEILNDSRRLEVDTNFLQVQRQSFQHDDWFAQIPLAGREIWEQVYMLLGLPCESSVGDVLAAKDKDCSVVKLKKNH